MTATGATGDPSDRQTAPDPAASATAPDSGRYATKAVLALVLGVAGIVLLLPAGLLALIAGTTSVILGHLAVREIRHTHDRGRAIAIGGLVAGYLTIGIVIVVLVTAVGVRSSITGGRPGAPDACTSTTGHFTDKQLQACFDQTNGD